MVKVRSELKRYISSQDPESVHDLRVSIRRLDASLRILPKENRRRRSVVKYSDQLQKLLRMNTNVRDYDILLTRLENRSRDPIVDDLIADIESKKKAILSSSKKKAKKASQKKPPSVGKISQKLLSERVEKAIDKLDSNITNTLPLVLSDPKRENELHTLRKKSKRLRYSLELLKGKDFEESVRQLTVWQDSLGSIHDSDVIIEFFQNENKNKGALVFSQILEQERLQRDKEYQNFVRSCEERFGNSIPKSILVSVS